MGGLFIVSTFALCNLPNIFRSKKAHAIHRDILGMNMNTEIM
jgi:hypothetical protein